MSETKPDPRVPPRKGLFRPEVSEANSESWLGEIRLAEPISHRVWAILAWC